MKTLGYISVSLVFIFVIVYSWFDHIWSKINFDIDVKYSDILNDLKKLTPEQLSNNKGLLGNIKVGFIVENKNKNFGLTVVKPRIFIYYKDKLIAYTCPSKENQNDELYIKGNQTTVYDQTYCYNILVEHAIDISLRLLKKQPVELKYDLYYTVFGIRLKYKDSYKF